MQSQTLVFFPDLWPYLAQSGLKLSFFSLRMFESHKRMLKNTEMVIHVHTHMHTHVCTHTSTHQEDSQSFSMRHLILITCLLIWALLLAPRRPDSFQCKLDQPQAQEQPSYFSGHSFTVYFSAARTSFSSAWWPHAVTSILFSLNSPSCKMGLINPNRSHVVEICVLILPNPFEDEHMISALRPWYAEPGGGQGSTWPWDPVWVSSLRKHYSLAAECEQRRNSSIKTALPAEYIIWAQVSIARNNNSKGKPLTVFTAC